MSSSVQIGFIFLFLISTAIGSDVIIFNVNNNSLIAVLQGYISLKNLQDLKVQIDRLEEGFTKTSPSADGSARSDVVILNVNKNALTATLTGEISSKNFLHLKAQINRLGKGLNKSSSSIEVDKHTKDEENACKDPQKSEDTFKAFSVEFLTRYMENVEYNLGPYKDLLLDFLTTNAYDELCERVLQRVYRTVGPNELVSRFSSGNVKHAILLAHALLVYIDKSGDLNNSAVLELADDLKYLQRRTDFSAMSLHINNTFKKILKKLPICARNLYFNLEFSIKNKGSNEFIIHPCYYPNFMYLRKGDAFKFFDIEYHYLSATNRKDNDENRYTVVMEISILSNDTLGWWNIELAGDYCRLKSVAFGLYLFQSTEDKGLYIAEKEDNSPYMLWQITKPYGRVVLN